MYIFLSLQSAKREKVPKREKQTRGLRPDAPWTPIKPGSTAFFTRLKTNGIASISAEARIMNSRVAAWEIDDRTSSVTS